MIIHYNDPPGWGPNRVHGNFPDQRTWDQSQALLYRQLCYYCDLQGNTQERTNELIVYGDLKKLSTIKQHPNRLFTAWQILKELHITNPYIVRKAISLHKKLKYDKSYYVEDWLHHLKCWINELLELGHKADVHEIYHDFLNDFVSQHEDDSGSDDYGILCHKIATYLAKILENEKPEIDPGRDIVNACRSFQSFYAFWIQKEVRLRVRCHRKQQPSTWIVDVVKKVHQATKGEISLDDLDIDTKPKKVLALSQKVRSALRAKNKIRDKPGAEETGYWDALQPDKPNSSRFPPRQPYKRISKDRPFNDRSRFKPPQARPPTTIPDFEKREKKLQNYLNTVLEKDLSKEEANYALRQMHQALHCLPLGTSEETSPQSESSQVDDGNQGDPFDFLTHKQDSEGEDLELVSQASSSDSESEAELDEEAECVIAGVIERHGETAAAEQKIALYLERRGFSLGVFKCLNLGIDSNAPVTQPHEVENIVDTGASVTLESSKTAQFVPGSEMTLKRPLALHQGQGQIKMNKFGLAPKFVQVKDKPDRVFVILCPTMAAPLDQNTTIFSATQLQAFGLGLALMPNGAPKEHKNKLFNSNGTVNIPLHIGTNGIPYFLSVDAAKARKMKLYDAFTGKPFNMELAKARAFNRFTKHLIKIHELQDSNSGDTKYKSNVLNPPDELKAMVHDMRQQWDKTQEKARRVTFDPRQAVHEIETDTDTDTSFC